MSHLCKKCKRAREYEYACPIYGYVFPSYCECDKFEEKDDKYRWHDLTKDLNDLPKPHTRLLFYANDKDYSGASPVRFKEYYSGYLTDDKTFLSDKSGYDFTNREFDIVEVIAWKYIEPFEVER